MTIHLDSGPRDPSPLCGVKTGETTTDHVHATCKRCASVHDKIIKAVRDALAFASDRKES